MRYYGIIKNDTSAGEGVCVSFFVQGCPNRCPGCHNPDSWDFNGGKEFTVDTLKDILNALNANGVQRNFCVMGGEPLCDENKFLTNLVITEVRKQYPDIIIYVWTGYKYEDLIQDGTMRHILELSDYLIDGPYVQELRDITLPMRGSSNQRIIKLHEEKENDNG